MSRDTNGNYTLPAGNPVVTDTLITPAWGNGTCSDLGAEITNSLDRSARGGMLAQLKLVDGYAGLPGIAFVAETTSGLYRISAGLLGLSLIGSEILRVSGGAAGISYVGTGTFVNGLQLVPAATGVTPYVSAYGADVNIDLGLTGKGTGRVRVGSQAAAASAPVFTGNLFGGSFVAGRISLLVTSPLNTSENTVWTIPIPAGSLGPNGVITIPGVVASFTLVGGALTFRFRIDGVLVLTVTSTGTVGTAQLAFPPITVGNQNSANSQLWCANSLGVSVTGFSLIASSAADTTLLKNITLTVQKANAGDVATFYPAIATINPGA